MKLILMRGIILFVLLMTCVWLFIPITNSSAAIVGQSEALKAYEMLWNSFSLDKEGCPIYPDEYGGEFIVGDILYVWLVDLTDEMQESYHSICNHSKNVAFLNAKYSLNELDALKEQVVSLSPEYKISGCVADRKENKLRIFLVEIQEETVFALKQLLGDIEFILEEQDYVTFCSTSLYAGSTLFTDTLKYTLGTCGTYNSQPAILTAGHCAPSINANVKYNSTNGTVFATITSYQFEDGETGDYAIATINSDQQSNYVTTNHLKPLLTYQSITGTAFNGWLPVGTDVYAYGCNTGLVSGTISHVNVNIVGDFITNNGWVHAGINGLIGFAPSPSSSTIQSGDSGGPVFMYYLNLGAQFLGNLSANNSSYVYYSPVSYAQADGFTVKTS